MPWAKKEPESFEKKVERLRKYRGQFDLGLDYTFGIFSKDEKVLIGSSGLHTGIGEKAREIGYWINAKYLKKGFATESVPALIIVGFEIEQLERIEIRCDPQNIPSQRIPKRLGFNYEGTHRNRVADTMGEPKDEMKWILNRENFSQTSSDFQIKAFDIINRQIQLNKNKMGK